MAYGQKIREIRRRELLSQESFAERIGVSRSVVSQIEIDRINPTLDTIKKIAEEFNVSIDFLMMEEEEHKSKSELMIPMNRPKRYEPPQFSDPDEAMKKIKFGLTSHFASSQDDSYSRKRLHVAEEKAVYSHFSHVHELQRIPLIRTAQLQECKRMGFMASKERLHDNIVLPLPFQSDWLALELPSMEKKAPFVVICFFIRPTHGKRGDTLLLLTAEIELIHGHLDFADSRRLIIAGKEVLVEAIREAWKVEWEMRRVG